MRKNFACTERSDDIFCLDCASDVCRFSVCTEIDKTPRTCLYESLKLSVGGVCKRCLISLRWSSEDRAGQMMNWRNFQKTQMAKVCLILEM